VLVFEVCVCVCVCVCALWMFFALLEVCHFISVNVICVVSDFNDEFCIFTKITSVGIFFMLT